MTQTEGESLGQFGFSSSPLSRLSPPFLSVATPPPWPALFQPPPHLPQDSHQPLQMLWIAAIIFWADFRLFS